jgi:hypothetical protein
LSFFKLQDFDEPPTKKEKKKKRERERNPRYLFVLSFFSLLVVFLHSEEGKRSLFLFLGIVVVFVVAVFLLPF